MIRRSAKSAGGVPRLPDPFLNQPVNVVTPNAKHRKRGPSFSHPLEETIFSRMVAATPFGFRLVDQILKILLADSKRLQSDCGFRDTTGPIFHYGHVGSRAGVDRRARKRADEDSAMGHPNR